MIEPIQISAIIGAALSLPTLVLSCKRVYRDRDWVSIVLLLGSIFLTATFVSAFFNYIVFLVYMLNPDNMQYRIKPIIIAGALLVIGLVLDIISYIIVKKTNRHNLWKCIVILLTGFVVGNLIFAVFGWLVTGLTFDMCFFGSCCACLLVTGASWGLNYESISVIINIYVQSGICVLSAAYLIYEIVQRYRYKKTLWNLELMLISFVYGLLVVGGFGIILHHYNMPLYDAFEKHRFYNPVMQNAGHIQAIRQCLPQNPGIPIYSVIVFFLNFSFDYTDILLREDILF